MLENIKEPVRNPRLSGIRRLRLFEGEGEGDIFVDPSSSIRGRRGDRHWSEAELNGSVDLYN